ncbi:MAG: BamA/TamA family outer membrane protein [Rhodothermales bacterium]|nr:BamA/TamA family outer membrane protein [Rhodothermales bacterium]
MGRVANAQFDVEASETRLPIVTDIKYVGDLVFPKESLRLRVRSNANREMFGPWTGIRWWLGLYRLGESGKLGKGLSRALMSLGEPPAHLDSSVVAADADRLRLFYQQEGYRSATVDYRVTASDSGRHLKIEFLIDPGPPTYIRRVDYEGLERIDGAAVRRMIERSLIKIESSRVAEGLPIFTADRERYSESKLLAERRRILSFLQNRGYALATRDSIRAIVFTVAPDSFDIQFRIRPGRRFRFGDVDYVVNGPESLDTVRRDTFIVESPTGPSKALKVTSTIFSERRLSNRLLLRSLQFQPGDWYDQSRVTDTKRRLENTGVFAFSDVQALVPDTADVDPPRLPHLLELRTRQRHQIRLETFVLQRTGLLGTSDTDLGMGFGATYRNSNLFGTGEALQLRATTSIAANSDFRLFRSTQGEVEAAINFPYIVRPFGFLERLGRLYDVRSRLSLGLLAARRDELKLIVRGRGAAQLRLELQHSRSVTSILDVVDITLSNPDTLAGFNEDFLEPVLGAVSDPIQQARILEDYTKPQVNNALRYTVISLTANPLRRDRGHAYEWSMELGGNLPWLLDRYVFSPDSVEGSLPGLPFFGGDNETRLIYRPYIRFISDIRQYRPVSRNLVVAWKALFGLSHPTGQSDIVPFDKRFFAGGAFSVRGWGLGELGPGSADLSSEEATSENIFGGDVKLELSAEFRRTIIRNLFAADWILTPFVDAGNVWFGPRNPGLALEGRGENDGRFRPHRLFGELGVGAGVGLRLSWEYFIARLDFADRVHDPVSKSFFIDRWDRPRLHFGIGHTF